VPGVWGESDPGEADGRVRLRDLDIDLFATGAPGPATRDLHDRLQALPELVPIGDLSEEPNGA